MIVEGLPDAHPAAAAALWIWIQGIAGVRDVCPFFGGREQSIQGPGHLFTKSTLP